MPDQLTRGFRFGLFGCSSTTTMSPGACSAIQARTAKQLKQDPQRFSLLIRQFASISFLLVSRSKAFEHGESVS